MKGQWLGKYSGDVEGNVMVNIDKVGDHFEAVAYINPYDKNIPSTVAYLDNLEDMPNNNVKAFLNPVNPKTNFQCKWEEIRKLFPEDVEHSDSADLEVLYNGDSIIISAKTDIDVIFNCELKKLNSGEESSIKATTMSWETYKRHVSTLLGKDYLFRGQEHSWPLKTTFHRHGRFRISEFTDKDVKQLHQRLCAITNHYFDLTDPQQNGAFFNLLQHHGYPTPLLDWSYSPYVAAFFAFRKKRKKCRTDEIVRIFLFNYELWSRNFPQILILDPPFPHLSVTDFIALDNPRMVPQQALTTVTNVENIEAYVSEKEKETGLVFIEAIDISADSREQVMMELAYMGITAGSVFPGIDGVCEEIKEKNF